MDLRPIAHIVLHVVAPGVVARLGWAKSWRRAWIIMVATMLVDLDHLLADPIYDPNRCSIGYHPLHSTVACAVYVGLVFVPQTRLVGVGLVIHMVLDLLDCYWMGLG